MNYALFIFLLGSTVMLRLANFLTSAVASVLERVGSLEFQVEGLGVQLPVRGFRSLELGVVLVQNPRLVLSASSVGRTIDDHNHAFCSFLFQGPAGKTGLAGMSPRKME